MLEQNKNPFKGIQGDLKDVPPELRKKVMHDIAIAKLIMEMATLFTGNYSAIIEGMLKTSDSNSKK
ncbi:hypothetical protein EJ994_01160 [Maribacter sp. MJ134]|uniref:hypothetical protein n=1 Tax=Maribacter sp. MJ134 TaxID=2496865 RepID=UPI000F84776D|nr:hypothetical protein [Maribacter sp. MJ134]AZQ57482.1 hypothetical protein EJ994_01160 [Maribacter sp. MJ134]